MGKARAHIDIGWLFDRNEIVLAFAFRESAILLIASSMLYRG